MPPLIGITSYGVDEQGSYSLPAEYVQATRRAGGVPVLIPAGEPHRELLVERLDAVILSGGGDIDPSHYGGGHHPKVYMVDADRDQMEIELARRVIDLKVPTLAICRGAQIVNVAMGGTLHNHLPDVYGEDLLHRLPPREPTKHAVKVDPNSRLSSILGETEFESASWHHQAIDEVSPRLRVAAQAPDGVVEAVEMPGHPWLLAVQWHPELTAQEDPVQLRLFTALVEAAIAAADRRNRKSI